MAIESFDNELFGLLIRRARKDAGYTSVEDFIKAVEDKTGHVISKDTLYKVEGGKSKITLETILAINITLYDRMNANQFWSAVNTSSSQAWKDIERNAINADLQWQLDHMM